MKTLFKLITLSAAAVIAYKAYEKNKKKQENNEVVHLDSPKQFLPEVLHETKLEDALVQSFKVQTQVMMDAYPKNQLIDIIHTVTFIELDQLTKYASLIEQRNIIHTINIDNLSINLQKTIHTEAQEAFNDIIEIAESTLDYHGIYQGWVFENLK